jgi:hypothetical protein
MSNIPVRLVVGAAFSLATLVLVKASSSALADSEWTLAVEALPSPAGANSAEPQLTVQGDRAILSWIERAGQRATVKLAERTASGWSEARTVVSGANLFVNFADVPSVRALADGTLAAHWLQEGRGNPDAYNVRLAWSKDGGRTWSPPTSPHHDGTQTQHGFASLFQAPGAGLGLVWLDGRATNPEAPEGSPEAGNMGLRAAVYGPDGKQRSETVIAARVCECCSTATAVTSDGAIVAFRNRSDKEVRDIYVSRLVDGRWSAPTPVHNDGWRLNACPINGPALSARNRDVAVAWFTVQQDQGRAFAAFSRDAGRTFGPPIRVDEAGSLGRVNIELLTDGSAAVSWVEFANQRSQFRVRRVEPGGARSTSVTIAGITEGRTSGVPRLVHDRDELLFAWAETDKGTSRIRTAKASLPAGSPGRAR